MMADLSARENEMLAVPPTKEAGGTGTRMMAIPRTFDDSASKVLALSADADSAVHLSDLVMDCMSSALLALTKF
jgi:hypothetical protein